MFEKGELMAFSPSMVISLYYQERKYLDDSSLRSVEREDVVIVAAVDIEVTSKDPTLAVISAVFFDINKGMVRREWRCNGIGKKDNIITESGEF